MKCSREKAPTAQFWPVFHFNADFKCHLCIMTFNVRLSCCSEGRDNLLALIIKGNQSKEKEKRDEKRCRYSRFKLSVCLWAVRDGADRNVPIFNRADVFLFPAFSLCLCITNKCYTTLQQKLAWLLQRKQKACQETRLPLTGLRFSLFT